MLAFLLCCSTCSIFLVSPNSPAISYVYISCVTELSFQELSRGITYEQSYGHVRVDTTRAGLGNRLRVVVIELWRVDPHDPLLLSACFRLPLSWPTLSSHCVLQCLAHSLMWQLGAISIRHVSALLENFNYRPRRRGEAATERD